MRKLDRMKELGVLHKFVKKLQLQSSLIKRKFDSKMNILEKSIRGIIIIIIIYCLFIIKNCPYSTTILYLLRNISFIFGYLKNLKRTVNGRY